MEGLPPDIERSLFKAVGAYLRATPPNELPARVRPFAGFTEAAMSRHKKDVLALLDDEGQRALIDEWLREDKPKLPKAVAANLALVLQHEDGWLEELKGRAQAGGKKPSGAPDRSAKLAESLEKEKAKTKKARDDLQKLRAEFDAALKAETARAARLTAELEAVRSQLSTAETHRFESKRDAGVAAERAEREVRRARKDAASAAEQRDALRSELKDVKKELRAAKTRIAGLERKEAASKATAKKAPAKAARPKRAQPARERTPLPIPKGRFEDAPETLDEWLQPGVTLVIDGYNVTKAERGFGELKLETQRDRLIKEVEQLARRKKVGGTIVFDGSEVPPGTSRSRRGSVRVEFSAPDEIADDHIVALVEKLPPDPVVVVTNDRELQGRVAALGATIARSDQLLGLIRP
jgi:predicted RNA-binding protein with PIN domain